MTNTKTSYNMKITLSQQLEDEAYSLSKEYNNNAFICVTEYNNLYSISFTDYQFASNPDPIVATIHYENGNQINDERFEFEKTQRINEVREKAEKIKMSLSSILNTESRIAEENSNWHQRFRIMKIKYELDNYKIAEITGNAYDSVRTTTQPNKDFPRNLKLAIWISEQQVNR